MITDTIVFFNPFPYTVREILKAKTNTSSGFLVISVCVWGFFIAEKGGKCRRQIPMYCTLTTSYASNYFQISKILC